MYGQGQYASQFGQSPNRPPRPPFMQQHSYPPASGGLLHPPAGQQPHATGQHYPPQTGHNSTVMQPYPTVQQGAQSTQYVSALPPPPNHSRLPPPPPSQSQNLYMQQMTVPLSASALPPPPPPPPMLALQTSSLPRPATFLSYPPPVPQSLPPLPPPPPQSSTLQSSVPMSSSKPINSDNFVQSLRDPRSSQASTTESVQSIAAVDRNRKSVPNDASKYEIDTKVDVPSSPPRPTNENTLRNIEVLCKYISQKGPAFEDMVRQNEARNPKFEFLFGGKSGSEAAIAHEYYLWMKSKMSLSQSQSNILLKDNHDECRSSVEPNNLKETSNSLSDSDMDMEDDITQPVEKIADNDQVSGLEKDFVSAAGSIEKQVKDTSLQSSQVGILTIDLRPPIKLEGDDGGRSNKTFESITQTEDPFRLLKDYASDDSSAGDAHLEVHEPVLQLQETITTTSTQCKMQTSSESKATEIRVSGSNLIGFQCKLPNELDTSRPSKISADKVIPTSRSLDKKVDNSAENNGRADASKQSVSHDLDERDALENSGVDLVSGSSKAQKVHAKGANPVKVDKFGRLIRENVSETDSDDSSCNRRRRRRGRSRSLSRSPVKRRRRSPWRRTERRSISRSWSPKRRRSRSRSPLRRAIDIGSKKNTRGRHQQGECFNYLKGRCYRGASCRFLHNDPDKYVEPRHYKSKLHASETRMSSRDHDYSEESKVTTRKESQEYDINGEELQHDGEVKANKKQQVDTDYASKGETADEKDRAEYLDGAVHYGLLDRDGSAAVIDRYNDTSPEGPSFCLHRSSHSKDGSDLSISHLQNDKKPELSVSCGKDEDVGQHQVASLKQENHAIDIHTQHMISSCPASSAQIYPASSWQPSEAVLSLSKKLVDPVEQKDQLTPDASAINYACHVSQLQPPMRIPLQAPPPSSLHVANLPHAPQPMPSYISAPSEPNVLPSNQHTQYHTTQYTSWGPMSTPFPPYMVTPPMHSGPVSLQQGTLPVPSMQPSLKTKPTDLPFHPQVGNQQENYMSMQGSQQPPQHVVTMHPGNLVGQAVASSNSTRDDRYVNSFASGPFSTSFPHGNIPPRPATSIEEAKTNKVQSSSHAILPSGEPSSSGFQNPSYLQQPHGLYQATGNSFRDPSHYSANLHRNHPSHISDAGSKVAAHYNPYASTFDQPISSNFSSDAFRQGQNPYGSHYENFISLPPAAFNGQRVAHEVSPIIPSPHSSRAGGLSLPKSGGDQYDPLFDSIEPSAESLKKQSEQEDHAADNSDIMFRLSGSKTSEVKGNRKNVLGAVATASSSETDEFGETADAEVIPEEAGSHSNLNDSAEGSAGDVEINQLKRDGKSKKTKDSRSMKLFKVELACFVKDMLKPSWRQGNMSKEAFKTIVKKTVEKVSGAMKGHRVPRSKEKIERYIDRSQRKLTTLVEGYVNKYAKA